MYQPQLPVIGIHRHPQGQFPARTRLAFAIPRHNFELHRAFSVGRQRRNRDLDAPLGLAGPELRQVSGLLDTPGLKTDLRDPDVVLGAIADLHHLVLIVGPFIKLAGNDHRRRAIHQHTDIERRLLQARQAILAQQRHIDPVITGNEQAQERHGGILRTDHKGTAPLPGNRRNLLERDVALSIQFDLGAFQRGDRPPAQGLGFLLQSRIFGIIIFHRHSGNGRPRDHPHSEHGGSRLPQGNGIIETLTDIAQRQLPDPVRLHLHFLDTLRPAGFVQAHQQHGRRYRLSPQPGAKDHRVGTIDRCLQG